MKKFAMAGAMVLAAIAAQVAGAQSCKPVVGSFEALIVPPGQAHCPNDPQAFCTAGRVWGGVQGTYRFAMTAAVPSGSLGGVPTIIFFTGRSTVLLKRGGQIVGTDTGSIDLPPGQGGFASLITFDGGGGQIRLHGEFDAAEGTTSGSYVGQLCS
jgi:hypothetical protein